MFFSRISSFRGLVPLSKEYEEAKVLLERFKDADEHRVRIYVASVLLNEEVMKKLESY